MMKLIVHFVMDQLQENNTGWCGVFCLYLMYNLYNPKTTFASNRNKRCSFEHLKQVMKEIVQ